VSRMTNEALLYTAEIIKDLTISWQPHAGQVDAGRAIFYEGKTFVFVECGRKWGKTDLTLYCAYRAAMTTPNAAIYYIAPFQTQAKELTWSNSRFQTFLDASVRDKYVSSINNSEMRIKFKNGSFIKLDGADNYEKYRGINPHFIIYDEFKDHHPMFHEAMEPNLATYSAPLLVIGTPPETDNNQFCRLADDIKVDPDGAYFNQPTSTNPHISKKYLENMRARLQRRGEHDVWMREYMAKRVKGGRNAIFPMFDDTMIKDYKGLIAEIRSNRKNFELYITADPATASTFGVLFSAIHKYTRIVYHLNELYIRDTRESSARKVWEEIERIQMEIMPDLSRWELTYDEAATWFSNEVMDITEGQVYFAPTSKAATKKEVGLSLMKDQMLYGFFFMTEKCKFFREEVENYIRDQNDKIKKVNDHLIDCCRYTNAAAYYTSVTSKAPKKVESGRRYHTLESDWADNNNDWTTKLLGDEYYE